MIWILFPILYLFCVSVAQELSFPAIVSATYKTISHQVPELQEYPSRTKTYTLYYDRNYGGVRIEYKNENGVDITLIRNYKDHYEARIESVEGQELCEYSYMGMSMPIPEFSSAIHPNKEQVSNGKKYQTFSFQEYRQYIDIYVDAESNFPLRLDEFYINEENTPEPVFSTVYESFHTNPIDPSLFDVLSLKESGKCTRNSKGWSYQYILGPFVKA